MILFGCPGVIPECPLDQSYETAYAKIAPVLLNAVVEMGPGAGSNAFVHNQISNLFLENETKRAFEPGSRVFIPKVDCTIRTYEQLSACLIGDCN
jgi:hypothetical protein